MTDVNTILGNEETKSFVGKDILEKKYEPGNYVTITLSGVNKKELQDTFIDDDFEIIRFKKKGSKAEVDLQLKKSFTNKNKLLDRIEYLLGFGVDKFEEADLKFEMVHWLDPFLITTINEKPYVYVIDKITYKKAIKIKEFSDGKTLAFIKKNAVYAISKSDLVSLMLVAKKLKEM